MSITRLKLTKYLTVLRKHIPGNSVHEIHQSMDGIEEVIKQIHIISFISLTFLHFHQLCSLLRIKTKLPYAPPVPVERAFEVSEPAAHVSSPPPPRNQFQPNKATPLQPVAAQSQIRKVRNTEHQSKKNFVEALQRSDNEYEIVVNDDGVVDILPGNQQLRSSSDSSDTEPTNALQYGMAGRRSRYEIPDDHLMSRKATKILGDRKEVEMHEFRRKLSSSSSSMELTGEVARRSHSRDFLSVPDVDPSGERDSPINDFIGK